MLTKTQATKYAAKMTKLHGETWFVFRTPDGAVCNQEPCNLYNTGRYHACPASEKADYEAGGAVFV